MPNELNSLIGTLEALEKAYPEWALDLRLCRNSIACILDDRLDPRHAAVLAAIAVGAQTMADICAELNMPQVTVFRTLKQLLATGRIEGRRGQYGIIYSLP